MSNSMENKVIVITGASSGMGEATARDLAAKGAKVVLGARRADRLDAIVKDIAQAGGEAVAVTTDVTKLEEVKKLVDTAKETYGRVDVIFNNAGLMPLSPLESQRIDEWDQMIDVNMKGTLYGIAAALPYMKEQKSGHVINVSSVYGHKVVATGARGLLCDQARRARYLRGTAPGSDGRQHPRDHDFTRRGQDGTDQPHHRARAGRCRQQGCERSRRTGQHHG
jgi:NAD(P)-dependent dehydrogenase (short-subunit alcohol dehydrogenase family)